jgi:ubiquinone/menaquinone biosynthesis C-methylase UbiE
MKNTRNYILFFSFFCSLVYGQKYEGELSIIEYNIPVKKQDHLFQILETKAKFLDFIGIKEGDVVAEIGSEDGVFLCTIATFYDSVTFYAQDINPKVLSDSHFKKTIKSYAEYRHAPETNIYKIVIGTENESKLPDNTFDKIFIMMAFHDFDNKNAMLFDLQKKLKPSGQLIIEDGFSYKNDTLVCKEFGIHKYMFLDSMVKLCERNGLYLTKMRNPNFHASHYGNLLIFEKNKDKSKWFLKTKMAVDGFVDQSFLLNRFDIASDSNKVKEIVDIILPNISEISSVYDEYDVWLKELALKYLRKNMYQAAINILKANVSFYPTLYQPYYWLGVAYQESKQYELAVRNLKLSLDINHDNNIAKTRINSIKDANR